jgi:hypothetical protein
MLDGLEALQSQLSVNRGTINDPSVATLLHALALDNPGLCVITTRDRITVGRAKEVRERALKFFERRRERDSLLAKGVEHLAMGRACTMLGETDDPRYWAEAETNLNRAVDLLRESRYQSYLPLGLLARAALRRLSLKLERARDDLDECLRIARRFSMVTRR